MIDRDRAYHIYSARIYLAEARSRRSRHRGFAHMLLQWAANARRRAAACKPDQADLFGGTA